MRAAIYARVSTEHQETDGQAAELRRYAAAYGWDTVEYVDRGVSGHLRSRPRLDALLEDARAGAFGVVLAWRLDRLGRSLQHVVNLVAALRAAGVRVVTPGEGFDSANDYAPVLLGVLAGFAEAESRRISARCRLSAEARRSRGERVGRKPRPVAVEGAAGLSHRAAARLLGVSVSTVRRRRARSAQDAPGAGAAP
jgi:DNA invertase Pin-like site-specific DNA recombinase